MCCKSHIQPIRITTTLLITNFFPSTFPMFYYYLADQPWLYYLSNVLLSLYYQNMQVRHVWDIMYVCLYNYVASVMSCVCLYRNVASVMSCVCLYGNVASVMSCWMPRPDCVPKYSTVSLVCGSSRFSLLSGHRSKTFQINSVTTNHQIVTCTSWHVSGILCSFSAQRVVST